MKNIIILFIGLAAFLFFLHVAGEVGVLMKHRSVVNSKYLGWKTFNNEKYGYSLKYPPVWGANTTQLEDGILLFSNPEYLKERIAKPETFTKEDYASIDASVYPYGATTAGGKLEENTNIEAFAAKNYSDIVLPGQYVTLNGSRAVILLRKRMIFKPEYPAGTQNCPFSDSSCYVEDGITQQVWVKLPKGLLLIEYNYGRKYKDTDNLSKVFQKVINSVSSSN